LRRRLVLVWFTVALVCAQWTSSVVGRALPQQVKTLLFAFLRNVKKITILPKETTATSLFVAYAYTYVLREIYETKKNMSLSFCQLFRLAIQEDRRWCPNVVNSVLTLGWEMGSKLIDHLLECHRTNVMPCAWLNIICFTCPRFSVLGTQSY